MEEIEFSFGQLVREHIEASDESTYETAALACLAASETAGATAEKALPAAIAIALVSQMGLVFAGLENSGGAASLSTAWGMPRALNAGDAMFALAQESILGATLELTSEDRLQATRILDKGSREVIDALFALNEAGDPADSAQRALLPAALQLGGLFGGADEGNQTRLAELGRRWAALPADELSHSLASNPSGWLAT
jgi:geranylgeranyl diphosphate synthase type I